MGSAFGSQVNPTTLSPLVGQGTQSDIFSALLNMAWANAGGGGPGSGSMALKGVQGYPSSLSPDTTQTRLPDVWNNWQPWDAGTQYLASSLYGKGPGTLDPTQANPTLKKMMETGGAGGPGLSGMLNMKDYGTPSQAGQYVSNMANYGVASTGSGNPLLDLAYGKPNNLSAYLMPFMANANPYSPPQVSNMPKLGPGAK